MKRRRFLGLLAAAPAAVPVVATEAAAKMSLASATSAASTVGLGSAGDESKSAVCDNSWLAERLESFWSDEKKSDREDDARHEARVLDPDLASMRSISPSAAYAIQRGRTLQRLEQRSLSWLHRRARDAGLPI